MSSVVNGIMQEISNPLQAIQSIASIAFPEASIALSLANMVTQAVGGAVNQAAQQLTSQCGMPGFLQDIIGQVVKDVLGQHQQSSNPDCDHACQNDFGQDLQQFGQDLTKAIVDGVKALTDPNPIGKFFDTLNFNQDVQKLGQDLKDLAHDAVSGQQGCGQSGGTDGTQGGGWNPNNFGQVDDGSDTSTAKGGGKGTNWLVALAKAMGDAAGNHAQRLVELSHEIDQKSQKSGNSDQDAQNAKDVTALQSEFQGESQLFSMLQNAFSNAIKSIGQGLQTMASKQ